MSERPGRRRGRVVLNVIIAVVAIYVAGVGALALMQRSLIYPAPTEPGPVPATFEQVTYTTSDGLELTSGYHPADEGMPTILFFHGNGARWQDAEVVAHLAIQRGYGVMGGEYRGYQGNPGSPTEEGLYQDGHAAVAYLEQQGVKHDDIVLIGNSLGSGVATQLAAEIDAHSLVLISPFASFTRAVQEKVRWAPVSLVLQDDFDNIGKIASVTAPILIIHGVRDDLIVLHHAFDLKDANMSARLEMIEDAGHEVAYLPVAQNPLFDFLTAVEAQAD